MFSLSLIISLSLLQLFYKSSQTVTQNYGPNLNKLLHGVDSCDLQIIHCDGYNADSQNFVHFHTLPTTILNLTLAKTHLKEEIYVQQIFKVRLPPCKISYVISNKNFTKRYNFFTSSAIDAAVNPRKFWDGYELQTVEWTNNLFVLVHFPFAHDRALRNFYYRKIELLARIKIISNDANKILISVWLRSFNKPGTVFEYFTFDGATNILHILQNYRISTKRWCLGAWYTRNMTESKVDLTAYSIGNPFDPKSSQSITLTLALTVVRSCNHSLFMGCEFSTIDIFHRVYYPISNFLVTDFIGYKFITCYSTSTITFKFYTTPFNPEVWIKLFMTFRALTAILWGFFKHAKFKGSLNFPCWMAVLGSLVEDVIPLPKILRKESKYRLIFGGWILGSIFLTNSYNGLMITGLNSPFNTNGVETFRDLVCNWKEVNKTNMASVVNASFMDWDKKRVENLWNGKSIESGGSQNCFSLLSFHDLSGPELIQYLMMELLKILALPNWNYNPESTELLVNLFHPNHRHFPRMSKPYDKHSASEIQGLVERELVECGKSVAISTSPVIKAENEYMAKKYFWIKMYTGKDDLDPFPTGLSFVRAGNSRIPLNFRYLHESGIYGRLTKEIYFRRNYARKPAGEIKPPKTESMTMDGCIFTLFILWAGISGLGLLCFLKECCSVYLKSGRAFGLVVLSYLKKLGVRQTQIQYID